MKMSLFDVIIIQQQLL